MNHKNVEIKAQCTSVREIRKLLRLRGARFVGRDHQTDTYFDCPNGRLKLRQGNIESGLIHYTRTDKAGPKLSQISRWEAGAPVEDLKLVLKSAFGVSVIVDKKREIYFEDNVKIHLDRVSGLGSFVEIEAIDIDGTRTVDELEHQCSKFMQLFGIQDRDLVRGSYSDMIRSALQDEVAARERAA